VESHDFGSFHILKIDSLAENALHYRDLFNIRSFNIMFRDIQSALTDGDGDLAKNKLFYRK